MAALTGFLALGTITDSGVFTEISGASGYARQAVSLSATGDGGVSNDAAIAFPTSSGANWAKFDALAIYTAVTGGSPLLAWRTPAMGRAAHSPLSAYVIPTGAIQLTFPAVKSSLGTPVSMSNDFSWSPGGLSYGASTLGRLRTRVGAIGDSITASLGANAWNAGRQYQFGDGPLVHAHFLAAYGWDLVVNAGIGGQRSDQIAARLASDVLSAGVDVCVIASCYHNDISQSIAFSQTMANIAAMCTQCVSYGALPVLCTPTPAAFSGSTLSIRTQLSQLRSAVLAYGRTNGYPVVDLYPVLIDVTTGALSSTYNLDGTVHPKPAGFAALGAAIATVLDKITSHNPVPLSVDPTDTNNLLSGCGNGLFLTNTAGVGTGWTFPGTSGATASIVTDGAVLGNMQQLATVATASLAFIDTPAFSGWSVGDVLEVSGILTSNGGAAPAVRFLFGGSPSPGGVYLYINPSAPVTRAKFRARQAILPGTTSVALRFQMPAGTGTAAIGQLAVRNLTTMSAA